MSADLLAAFGDVDVSKTEFQRNENAKKSDVISSQQPTLVDNSWQPWPAQPVQASRKIEDDTLWETDQGGNDVLFDAENLEFDDFGDFEQADVGGNAPIRTTSHQHRELSTNTDLLNLDDTDKTTVVGATDLHSISGSTPNQNAAYVPATQHTIQNVTTTLIDAEDDWGDFEDGTSGDGIPPSSAKGPLNAPGASFVKQATNIIPAKENNKKPIPSRSVQTKVIASQNPSSAQEDDFEIWDDFNVSNPTVEPEAKPGEARPIHKTFTQSKKVPQAATQDRPTNIPPPAVLLSLVPKAFSSLASQAQQSNPAESTSSSIVQAYIVCARIIAGRTYRWKRDTVLAQSMRIGAAGRSGGMKLTAIDKGESRREDQEVEEAITSWSKYSHRLNPVLIKSKIQKPPMSLSPNLVVRTATGADILTANHPCPVCGLRRNERINGIDVNVSDTFGEFWVEHWGHKSCYDFWYCYNELLGQR